MEYVKNLLAFLLFTSLICFSFFKLLDNYHFFLNLFISNRHVVCFSNNSQGLRLLFISFGRPRFRFEKAIFFARKFFIFSVFRKKKNLVREYSKWRFQHFHLFSFFFFLYNSLLLRFIVNLPFFFVFFCHFTLVQTVIYKICYCLVRHAIQRIFNGPMKKKN